MDLRKEWNELTGEEPTGQASEWTMTSPVAHLSYVEWLEEEIQQLKADKRELSHNVLSYAWRLYLEGNCDAGFGTLDKLNKMFNLELDFTMSANEAHEILTKHKEKS